MNPKPLLNAPQECVDNQALEVTGYLRNVIPVSMYNLRCIVEHKGAYHPYHIPTANSAKVYGEDWMS